MNFAPRTSLNSSRAWNDALEPEARIVPPAIVRAAAAQACGTAPERLHPRERHTAACAAVMMAACHHAARQRQVVRALFIRQAEIAARLSPLRAVRCDPASARALVREEVREFVSESALDFRVAEFTQPRIQPHE